MSQKQRILEHLERGMPISGMMALRHYRCMRLAARVLELRGDGVQITTEYVHQPDGVRYAVYRLDAQG